jgi:DUF4097 and DUF4098 domain-containing protein YvlB
MDAGDASVIAGGDGTVEVRPRHPSKSVEVRCPAGTDVMVGTASGRIDIHGAVGRAHATTTSAKVTIEAAAAADLRTVSGGIEVGTCYGSCRAATQSGSIRVGQAEEVAASTVAGSIHIGHARSRVEVHTVSGKVALDADGEGAIAVKTVSGPVSLRLPGSLRPELRVRTSGRKLSRIEPGDGVRVSVTSVTGKVEIQPR